jgi:hypothetical protein
VIIRIVVLSVAASVVLGAGVAAADCCVGPAISMSLPYDAPLTVELKATVANDDPDHHADGDVHGLLNVAGRRVADLGTVHVVDVSPTPQAVTFWLGTDQLAAVRAAGMRAHTTRGTIHFVISNATARPSGIVSPVYAQDSFVSLTPGVHTTGPTRLSLTHRIVSGSGQRLRGSVAFTPPRAWRRTSADGASPAAFGPIAITARCNAYLLVQGVAVAAGDPRAYVDAIGGPGNTVASGRRGSPRWRVRASAATDDVTRTAAIGIARIAQHRYAGVRVDVHFDPDCAASAARSSKLIPGLTRLARDLSVHARLRRTARGPY